MSDPKNKPKTFDHWPSKINESLGPAFDADSRKRAALTAVSTIGAATSGGNPIPSYISARVASAIPPPQDADLSKMGKGEGQIPADDIPSLIKALLGKGTKNKGIVFGDGNHLHRGIPEAFADPKTIAALKSSGVTHVCLEMSPATLKGYREPSRALEGHPFALTGYHNSVTSSPFHKFDATAGSLRW